MKVGIITFYYDITNYGANLQAYALCRWCNKIGFDTEQLCYYDSYGFKKIFSWLYRHVFKKKYYKNENFYQRKMSIKRFRDKIPHSKLYCKNTLVKANDRYDAFIVGSDQVWNPDWINQAFKLEFVQSDKLKISYAASLGRECLSQDEKSIFMPILNRIDFISVREENSIGLLSELTDKKVEWVLDPTLLLDSAEWDEVCSDRFIEDDYLFCYYLNEYQLHRDIAVKYAKEHNLKIVTLPFLSYKYRKCDDGFGDYQLYAVSPGEFVSLIKYAKCVFTDSFHATVFSHLYKKDFVVFSQSGKQSKARMDTLTRLFGTEERHLVGDEAVTLSTIDSFRRIDYTQNADKYRKTKEKSEQFLLNALSRKG